MQEINFPFLKCRYSARGKRREKETLEQGLKLQGAPSVAAQPLPLPILKPKAFETGAADPHGFMVNLSTVGQSTKGRRRIFPEQPVFDQPVAITNIPPVKIAPVPSQVPIIHVPYSTKHYHKKKQQSVEEGNFKRPYVRKALVTSCGKCGEDRSGGGHQQYFGNIYCPLKTAISCDAWKAELRGKGYGKRKAKADKTCMPVEKTAKEDLSSGDK